MNALIGEDNLDRLIVSKFGCLTRCSIYNLSLKKLTKQESFALILSLDFSLPCYKIDREKYFMF